MKKLTLTILGTTASGKSKFAIDLAQKISAEIISLDSASIYKEFNIGTAKPLPEERESVPHHLIDIASPDEPFSAFHFIQFSKEAILQIESNKKIPLICGGSYFYLRALEHGMYPDVNVPQTVLDSLEQEYTEDDTLQTEKMHKELSKVDPESAKKIHPKDMYRLLRALSIYRFTKVLPSTLQAKPILEDSSQRKHQHV
jgi:tRNA dimethylallyltransferase